MVVSFRLTKYKTTGKSFLRDPTAQTSLYYGISDGGTDIYAGTIRLNSVTTTHP